MRELGYMEKKIGESKGGRFFVVVVVEEGERESGKNKKRVKGRESVS
jgi:hypothetical protein